MNLLRIVQDKMMMKHPRRSTNPTREQQQMPTETDNKTEEDKLQKTSVPNHNHNNSTTTTTNKTNLWEEIPYWYNHVLVPAIASSWISIGLHQLQLFLSMIMTIFLPNWSSYHLEEQLRQQAAALPSFKVFWETNYGPLMDALHNLTTHYYQQNNDPNDDSLRRTITTASSHHHHHPVTADELLANMTDFLHRLVPSSILHLQQQQQQQQQGQEQQLNSYSNNININNDNTRGFLVQGWTWIVTKWAQEWPLLDWKLGVFLWRTFGGLLLVLCLISIVPGSLHGWSGKLLRWPVLALTYLLIYVELVVYIVIRLIIRVAEWAVARPKHRKLRRCMAQASSYEEWYQYAQKLDQSQNRHIWLQQQQQQQQHSSQTDNASSYHYNWTFIKELYKDMQCAMEQGDSIFALAVIQQCTRPNVGGIMNSDLFSYSNTGEPKLIVQEFLQQVVKTLHWITDQATQVPRVRQWNVQEKTAYQQNIQAVFREEREKLWKSVMVGTSSSSHGDDVDNEDNDNEENTTMKKEKDSAPRSSSSSSSSSSSWMNLNGKNQPASLVSAAAMEQQQTGALPPYNNNKNNNNNNNNHLSSPLPAVHRDQVLDFLKRARAAYGRTAFCLSGGAMMGLYHFGVIKGLAQQGVLPHIVSGTSAGSVVGAIVCTRTDNELMEQLQPHIITQYMTCFDRPWKDRIQSLYKYGYMFDVNVWMEKIKWFTNGDMTFEEAYKRTGRIFCITLSSTSKKAPPVLVNYLSCPNVTIASAVLASAAVPGFIAPLRLQYKDDNGIIRGYGDHDQAYFDGSIRHDIPISGLAEMLNCQFFIASQCNPHIVPFFFNPKGGVGRPSRWSSGEQEHSWRGGFLLAALEMYLKNDMKAKCVFLHDLEAAVGFTSTMMTQDFVGSTTIVPQVSFQDYFKLFSDPQASEMQRYFQCGEVAAYEHTAMIKLHYSIADALDECIVKLESDTPVGHKELRSTNTQHASFQTRSSSSSSSSNNKDKNTEKGKNWLTLLTNFLNFDNENKSTSKSKTVSLKDNDNENQPTYRTTTPQEVVAAAAALVSASVPAVVADTTDHPASFLSDSTTQPRKPPVRLPRNSSHF